MNLSEAAEVIAALGAPVKSPKKKGRIGRYEAEAMERRRDELMEKRKWLGLNQWEGAELDRLVAAVGEVTPEERTR